jgi:hypothetical protein
MAAMSGLSALPYVGSVAGTTLNMCKLSRAASYTKLLCNIVGYGSTTVVSISGAVNNATHIYNNITEGNLVSLSTAEETLELGINIAGAVIGGTVTYGKSKQLKKLMSEDLSGTWRKVAGNTRKYSLVGNDGGFVDFGASIIVIN